MRKSIAIVLGIILALHTPVSLYASEYLDNESENSGNINTESSSYVVLMEEGTELVQTMSAQGETNMMAVTEAAAEDLKDQNIAVLELTEEEVKELERRSDVIAVEEDIILTANGSGLEGVREYKRERAIDRREDQWNLWWNVNSRRNQYSCGAGKWCCLFVMGKRQNEKRWIYKEPFEKHSSDY